MTNFFEPTTPERKNWKSEQGQSFVTMSIGILAFLAILALAIDGGMTYANRRQAQNAADAGALAGAREWCINRESDPAAAMTLATSAAAEYAITRNGADTVTVVVSPTVDVTTTVTFNSFFAQLFGFPEITAQAEAAAGCVSPGLGEGVLPIAWSCQPPVSGTSTSQDCEMQAVTSSELEVRKDAYPNGPDSTQCADLMAEGKVSDCTTLPELWPELYIVMTDISTGAEYCMPDGNVDCDFDNDGENDLVGEGGREWLDLDGDGGGAAELKSWISTGFPGEIIPHTWIPRQSGATVDVFHEAALHVGEIFVIPVFDYICENDPPGPGLCGGNYHTSDDIYVDGTESRYYHIIGFAALYISCVDANPYGPCPGHDFAAAMSTTDDFDNNTRSIEGYFLKGFVPGVNVGSGGLVDTGVYVLLLTK